MLHTHSLLAKGVGSLETETSSFLVFVTLLRGRTKESAWPLPLPITVPSRTWTLGAFNSHLLKAWPILQAAVRFTMSMTMSRTIPRISLSANLYFCSSDVSVNGLWVCRLKHKSTVILFLCVPWQAQFYHLHSFSVSLDDKAVHQNKE